MRLRFSSLYSRMLILIVLGLISAFTLSNYVWLYILEGQREEQGAVMARDVAFSMGSTMEFIKAYPREYRHIIINQLRDMGGSRFLVSINDEFIDVAPIRNSSAKESFLREFRLAIEEKLGQRLADLHVEFADPRILNVYKSDIRLVDLPPRWAQNTLILEPDPPPVMVAQVPVDEGEWLYLAGLLPEPYFLNEPRYMDQGQLLFLLTLMVTLLFIFWIMVRWLTRPLLNLARAARQLGTDIHLIPLEETGTREVKETARAFNIMQERVLRFVDDRERLFSAISHDLKTPITRLRLRAEMMDDSQTKERMIRDLEELESMVKGALDLGRSTDVHEQTHAIDINQLVATLAEELKVIGHELDVNGQARRPYYGKPLALKRCLSNLLHNAAFYGTAVRLDVVDSRQELKLYVIDNGPGIPEDKIDQVFEPYVRLESSRNRNTGGAGLGLSIARNIAHAHGGQLRLRNRIGAGLEAAVILPRQ
ncbi:MAG: ATP-binding protein [Saccharospirillum sp.]